MFKLTAAQRKKINAKLGRWKFDHDYKVNISGVNSREVITHKDKLKDYFKSKDITKLTFFRMYQNHRLFGYIVHGVHKDKIKTNGVLCLCTLMLDNFNVKLISDEISDNSDKDGEIVRSIEKYFFNEWYYNKPSKNWLRVYDKVPINNAQARSASVRLKERRYQTLLRKYEHCMQVLTKQKELNKETNAIL